MKDMSKYLVTVAVVIAALAIYFIWVGPMITKTMNKTAAVK